MKKPVLQKANTAPYVTKFLWHRKKFPHSDIKTKTKTMFATTDAMLPRAPAKTLIKTTNVITAVTKFSSHTKIPIKTMSVTNTVRSAHTAT